MNQRMIFGTLTLAAFVAIELVAVTPSADAQILRRRRAVQCQPACQTEATPCATTATAVTVSAAAQPTVQLVSQPVGEVIAPVESAPIQTTMESAPMSYESAPIQSAPISYESAPVQSYGEVIEGGAISSGCNCGSSAGAIESAPMSYGMSYESAAVESAPMSYESAPVSYEGANTWTPAEAPMSYESAPVASDCSGCCGGCGCGATPAQTVDMECGSCGGVTPVSYTEGGYVEGQNYETGVMSGPMYPMDGGYIEGQVYDAGVVYDSGVVGCPNGDCSGGTVISDSTVPSEAPAAEGEVESTSSDTEAADAPPEPPATDDKEA